MQEALPLPKGTDELTGKTYNGTNSYWDSEQKEYVENVKDPDSEYIFGANKTYTYKYEHNYRYGYSYTETRTGSYSYDSTKKEVYFSIVTRDGKTAAEYYEAVTVWGDNRYIDDDAYKAAETNNRFKYDYYKYDPTQKLIGWFY